MHNLIISQKPRLVMLGRIFFSAHTYHTWDGPSNKKIVIIGLAPLSLSGVTR